MTNSQSNPDKLGFLNLIIIVLSVYVLFALLVDTFFTLPSNIHDLLQIIDDGICFVFIYEFFHRLIIAENKLKFLKWGWIDLVSSIPSFPFIRFGRLFRLVRLLRILRAFRSVRVLAKHIFRNRVQGTMSLVTIITCLIVIFSSISILIVEKDPNSNIKSAEDAVWWSLVTVTTVGYGDKFPVTTEGRIIGVILMFVGVGMFGTFTAYVASWFTAGALKEKETKEKIEAAKEYLDENSG
jgi:voltage-gated potassium channel